MEQLANSLLVPRNGRLVPLSTLLSSVRDSDPDAMAAAAVSAPLSLQEQNDLPLRTRFDNALGNSHSLPPSGPRFSTDESVLSLGPSAFFNLQSIEDFDKEHAYDPHKLVPMQSTRVSVESTIKFQHLCDKHQIIRPKTQYVEPWPMNFKAKIVLGDETLETAEVYSSHKQANEALSKLALERFPFLISTGVKRKADESNLASVDKSENWVGLLYDNFQRKKRYEPCFQGLTTQSPPYRYSYTVSLDGGRPEPFQGSLCSSIKNAKADAAKQAVEWLRKECIMVTPVKRPKPDTSSHIGAIQALHAIDLDAEGSPALESPPSNKQRLHTLVASLGFIQPSWQVQHSVLPGKPDATKVAIYDVALRFGADAIAREPSLAGSIGQVEQIHGLKKAKEACCERVLAILEDIKQKRSKI